MENKYPTFNIELNYDQISLVLSTLAKLPYEHVASLMDTIQSQANSQIKHFQEIQNSLSEKTTDDVQKISSEEI